MLPRPSTTISLAGCSAWVTIDPSGSWRRSLSPVTSSLPSGSQSMEYPIGWLAGSLVNITSALPSRPTATTCRSIQWQNHSRPSCHRGDSGIPRPLSRTPGSGMAPPHLAGLGRPQVGSSTYYTNDGWSDRQGEAGRCGSTPRPGRGAAAAPQPARGPARGGPEGQAGLWSCGSPSCGPGRSSLAAGAPAAGGTGAVLVSRGVVGVAGLEPASSSL